MPGSDDQILRAGVAGTGQHLFLLGAGGDLACRMLFPSLFFLELDGLLPEGMRLTGVSRTPESSETFRNRLAASLSQHSRALANGGRKSALDRFLGRMDYQALDITDPESLRGLGDLIAPGAAPLYYFATSPSLFGPACRALKVAGLAGPEARIVLEKPLGRDLKSCRALHDMVGESFSESQILRVDHYLGKETVQNLIALRFGNALFEPLWNSRAIDHVQITIAETEKVGDRWPYYDEYGALRDMLQNHLLQLLALTAMEEPVSFDAADLRAEKEKVLSAVRLPRDLSTGTARGQYASGWQGGELVPGFLEEEGMNPESVTETYAAMRLDISTRRWAGVPFYLRAGKRLGRRVTEIAVVFKRAPQYLFAESQTSALGQNALVIRVQPDEGVTIRFGSKVPGAGMQVRDVTMDFGYGHAFTEASPEAYERLILDVLLGDPPLFPRHEEVELSWKILDPIEEFWATQGRPEQYAPGTWGPKSADDLLARDGRVWRRP